MPTSQNPSRSPRLPCAVARKFLHRPALFDVANQLLLELWPAYQLGNAQDPASLQLASFGPVPGVAYVRPLYEVLVERFCMRATLNLTPGEDVVCKAQTIDPDLPVPIDLPQLEALLNDSGPLLLDKYCEAIVDYWGQADSSGETPWLWFAHYLQGLLRSATDQVIALDRVPAAHATLLALSKGPAELEDLLDLSAAQGITLQTLASNFSADWQLDPSLASALLIERAEAPGRPPFTLLFTPAGRLLSYPSRERLLEAIREYWPAILASAPPQVKINTPDRQLFQALALNLLQELLESIEVAATAFHDQNSAERLADALDRLTSLTQLCSVNDQAAHAALFDQLPGWVRQGDPRSLIVYSTMLTDVARSSAEAEGKSWLDGVPSAQAFACERLASLIRRDHPDTPLDPATVQVINHQTTATAIPVGGQIISDGASVAVTFSLAQLAIANLGLLKPGRVTLETTDGQAIPAWLDTAALQRLITEADIGANYPKRLQALLLDNPQQRSAREQRLAAQLRTQLPAQVMTHHLQHGKPTLQALTAVQHVFSPMVDDQSHWVLRPLGLLRSLDAQPDHPHNAWLIENDNSATACCLLYRPLHREPLVEFSDRLALLVAISEPGDLQDDILHRLPEEDRRIYAHGGFLEPHLFHPLDDDWAVPLFTPAPVTLAREAPVAEAAPAIYQACVEETLRNFKAQSASSDETRWQRWETLGWLLLNSVLPFVEGPIAEAAWLVQMETALAQLVDDSDPPGDRSAAWIELLVNVALLIFSHAMARLDEQNPLDIALAHTPTAPALPAPVVVTGMNEAQVEFAWTHPTLKLDSHQAKALANMQVAISPTLLGTPIPSGPMRGLYLHQDQLWVRLQDQTFKVKLDPQSERLRIVGDDQALGPWLRRDEVNRWQLDLRLRLRGGMPLSKRVAKLQEQRRKTSEQLLKRVADDSKSITEQLPTVRKVHALGQRSDDARVLRSCLDKLRTFETFVAEHIERLHEANAQAPLPDYKNLRAGTLFHRLDCQLNVRDLLLRLYKPERAHLLDMAKRQADATPEDEAILRKRLGVLASVVDELFDNAIALNEGHEQLRKLASPSLPNVSSMLQRVEQQKSHWTPLFWRYIRIETCVNRISLEASENVEFWIDRAWDSIELAIGQQQQLSKRSSDSEEVRRRLLANIAQHLATARARLQALQDALEAGAEPAPLKPLLNDINDLRKAVASELAEYPDLPARSTVSQLSRQLPGLIETRDDGLLLGQPRADDADIVDVPGAEQDSVSCSYKRDHEQWVPVATPAAGTLPTALPAGKLKGLLRESARRLASARQDLALMQSKKANAYLPADIQDILLHHQAGLDRHRSAIEARLTRDNQTDEGSGEADAALSIKAIEDLSATLAKQAIEQRTRVALLQKPKMAELRFLLGKQQVEIQRTGPRRQLAKVAGRSDDDMEEFAIIHQGSPRWYAHFHFASREVEQAAYTAGHLKTAEQRYASGRSSKDANGREVEVYRSPIDLAAAKQYFFDS